MGKRKGRRRLSLWVTAQTAWNLEKLARMCGRDPGFVVDKLVRDRMVQLRMFSTTPPPLRGASSYTGEAASPAPNGGILPKGEGIGCNGRKWHGN